MGKIAETEKAIEKNSSTLSKLTFKEDPSIEKIISRKDWEREISSLLDYYDWLRLLGFSSETNLSFLKRRQEEIKEYLKNKNDVLSERQKLTEAIEKDKYELRVRREAIRYAPYLYLPYQNTSRGETTTINPITEEKTLVLNPLHEGILFQGEIVANKNDELVLVHDCQKEIEVPWSVYEEIPKRIESLTDLANKGNLEDFENFFAKPLTPPGFPMYCEGCGKEFLGIDQHGEITGISFRPEKKTELLKKFLEES